MRNYFLIAAVGTILVSCSTNGKKEILQSSAVCISDTSRKAGSVYLTSDEKHDPVISWCETDDTGKKFLYLRFFEAAGEKFSPAISVPVEQNASFHEEGMPKVAVKGDGSWVIVYETSSPTKENEWSGDVHYIQSSDKGKSWTSPRAVHANAAPGGSHSFAAVTRLGNGEIGACWLDQSFNYKKGGRPVKFASTNGKDGFGSETLVDSVACECCRLAITATAPDKVSIVYRDIINDSIRDISISTSLNNGQSFGSPVSFSEDHWNINGCPHNGPDVVNTAGASYAVWFTGGSSKGVYYSELDSRNTVVSKRQLSANGRNTQLSLLPDGARVVAYSDNIREGDSMYSSIVVKKIQDGKIVAKEITPRQGHAAYPVIKTFGDNKIVVAWADNGRVYYELLTGADIRKEMQEPLHHASEVRLPAKSAVRLAMPTDPVCGMRIGDAVEDTAIAAGKTLGFCSKTCKEKFMGDVDKYISKVK